MSTKLENCSLSICFFYKQMGTANCMNIMGVYIGSKTFNGDGNLVYFIIYLVIVMTFSPIGEELFYRGGVDKKKKRINSGMGLIFYYF